MDNQSYVDDIQSPGLSNRKPLQTQKSTIHLRRQQAVCVRRAYKSYGSKKNPNVILDGMNMTVPKGCIYGLLGASGCGKTTLLSCIVGRRVLNSGDIWVLGGRPGSRGSGVPGHRVGYMPQETALFGEFTIRETMIYFGWINGMKTKEIEDKVDFLVKLLQLPSPNKYVKLLSGGQQRRTSLAAALIHQPELLILDEPTVGVDPILRQSIWDHLVEITSEGKTTVIITTHYIDETRQAHMIGLMRGGKFLAEESPDDLMAKFAAESLEEVFLKLSIIQNKGKRRRSSIVQEVTESIQVPDIPNPDVVDIEEAGVGEISGEFGDNISMTSRGKKPSQEEVFGDTLPPEEEAPPLTCMDRFKPVQSCHMKALVWKNVLTLIRNTAIMFFIIVLPVSQIILFCITIGHNPEGLNIAYVNRELPEDQMLQKCNPDINKCDYKLMSCKFLKCLEDRKANMVPYKTEAEAMAAALKGKAWGVITIPEGFSAALENRFNNLDRNKSVVEESTIGVHLDTSNKQIEYLLLRDFYDSYNTFADQHSKSCNYIKGHFFQVPMQITDPIYGDKNGEFTDFAGPGVILTIIFFLAVALTSVAMVVERNEGILERSLVSGITGTEILFSHVIVQFMLMCLQTLLVLVFSFAVFGLTVKGPIIWVIILTLLTGICGMTFGFVVSCICDTERTATYLSLGSFLPMIMLCGIIWPVEGMHKVLRYISYLLPLTKCTESLRSILQKGWGITTSDVYLGYVSITIWIAIYLTTSILLIKFKKG